MSLRQILLVEDSKMFGRLAKSRIEKVFDVPVFWTKSLAETENLLIMAKGQFSVALLDFSLPDAPNGEVIDLVVSEGITTFVFTSDLTEEVRNLVWSKKVADYILKEDRNSLDYIIGAIRQLEDNQGTNILVVGDSNDYRTLVSELLYIRKFRIINATDGEAALAILNQYPEIKLVVTDYAMSGMDGCTLCQKIRENFKQDRLAIIGFSSSNEANIGARFIKSGANDFILRQTFLVEDFYCRLNHCMESLRLIETIRNSAVRDFLTGLHNRRYFFDAGKKLFDQSCQKKEPLACVMLDIDNFKAVNDSFGHVVGDLVIQSIGRIMRDNANTRDIVARIGGEEFCILAPMESGEEISNRLEQLRNQIETTPVALIEGNKELFVTVSIGVCWEGVNLEAMMQAADKLLYDAKKGGRNRVECQVVASC